MDLTNNWWGASSGPGGVGPGTGDSIINERGGVLTFTPFSSVLLGDCPYALIYDVNDDDLITPADAAYTINRVGVDTEEDINVIADFNQDGEIDDGDVESVIGQIGETVPQISSLE